MKFDQLEKQSNQSVKFLRSGSLPVATSEVPNQAIHPSIHQTFHPNTPAGRPTTRPSRRPTGEPSGSPSQSNSSDCLSSVTLFVVMSPSSDKTNTPCHSHFCSKQAHKACLDQSVLAKEKTLAPSAWLVTTRWSLQINLIPRSPDLQGILDLHLW